MKRCQRCGEDKPLDAFYAHRQNKDGRHSWCKSCVAAYQEDRRALRRNDPAFLLHDREMSRARTRRAARALRLLVVEAYGGRCACCGEAEEAFLALDHRFDDGAAERRSLGIGRANPDPLKFYRWLRDQGFPKDRYQLLCHNCNFAKARRGVCPHQAP